MPTTTHDTIPGRCYAVRCTSITTVSALRDGATYTLLTHAGDSSEQYFTAISPSVTVESSGKYALQELFSAAPLASAGGGGGTTTVIVPSGIMPTESINSYDHVLKGGVMHTIHANTDLDMAYCSLPAQEGQCVTCELVVQVSEYMDSALMSWPESWEWVDGIETTGRAPTLERKKNYYFAIRTFLGKTVINHYLTTDQA